MPIILLFLVPVLAAPVSWHLASRQGRPAMAWALWTLLLGGLPLIMLVIFDLFPWPKFGGGTRYTCCDQQSWTSVADFGHAGGCDLDLGKCAACGTYLMAVGYHGPANHVVLSDERAQYFLGLQGTPALKKALKDWVD